MRRLPIYLLINTSSAISNETLLNFNDCIKLLIETLQEDPYALETAHISIITFDSTITKLCSLSPLSSFKIPSIKLGRNESSLEYIFLQLSPIIDDELVKTTSTKRGDWKPLVFIFSDNDSVINITREEAESVHHKCGRIIVCTTKDSVNGENYKNITETILSIESFDKLTIKSQFRWVSGSIDASDKGECSELELPPPHPSVYIDIESNYSGQKFTYEPVCRFTTLPDNTMVKELQIVYEKTIACLIRQQEQLKSVQSQIDELKNKKNEIEYQKDEPSEPRNPIAGALLKRGSCAAAGAILGGPLGAIIGGIAGIFASLTIKSSNNVSERDREILLECDKELEAKMAQAQICEKQIEGLVQKKNNLEKGLALLEETNKYNEVYSSIFAPAEFSRDDYMMIQVYLYRDEEQEKVATKAKLVDPDSVRKNFTPLDVLVKKGDRVNVHLQMAGKGLEPDKTDIEMIYQDRYTDCQFCVYVPENYKPHSVVGTVTLSVNGVPAGRMMFKTKIVDAPRSLYAEIMCHKFNKIFISYSHYDEDKVKFIHKAYEALNVEHFFDRAYLRPGDVYPEKIRNYIASADLFILCWSENAKNSEYVQLEIVDAMKRAYPGVEMDKATLAIHPLDIEPHAELPEKMNKVYHFGRM